MCRLVRQDAAARVPGGVVERLMAPVLKTGRAQALVGSNPTPSASQLATDLSRGPYDETSAYGH